MAEPRDDWGWGMSDAWYYVENNTDAGPVSCEQLRQFLRSPRGGKSALVWREGLSDWKAAGELNELADVFKRPPPIPHRAPPLSSIATSLGSSPVLTPPAKESAGKKAQRIATSLFSAFIGIGAVKVFGDLLLLPTSL